MEKILKKLLVGIFLMVIILPFVLSDSIGNTNIEVSVYNTTPIYINGNLTTFKVEINNSLTAYNHHVFSFTINLSEGMNINEDFDFLFIKNETVGEDIVDKYTTCLSQKATCELTKSQFNTAWDNCIKELNEKTGENSTECQNQIASYNLKIQEKDLAINSKDQEITRLQEEQTNNKNSKWFWAIGGLILGVLGLLFKQGKLGGSAKDRSEGEFNRVQAG